MPGSGPIRERKQLLYLLRYRRDRVGELVQVDGLDHRWFMEYGPHWTLLLSVESTSRLMHLMGSGAVLRRS